MDIPGESTEPVESTPHRGTPLTVIFRNVPAADADQLEDVLRNNPVARRALMLFLQDSGLIISEREIRWEVTDVQNLPSEKSLDKPS